MSDTTTPPEEPTLASILDHIRALDERLLRQQRLQLAPQRDAFEQRAARIHARQAVSEPKSISGIGDQAGSNGPRWDKGITGQALTEVRTPAEARKGTPTASAHRRPCERTNAGYRAYVALGLPQGAVIGEIRPNRPRRELWPFPASRRKLEVRFQLS